MGKEVKGRPTTYLDFGNTIAGRRTSYDYYEDQSAYDLFMGARYMGDMIAYRNGEVDKVYQREDLRDQNRKYAALVALKVNTSQIFYEVGSSLMGVIDALEFLNKTFQQLSVTDIAFIGVDNSRWMNEVAQYTHPQYKLKLYYDIKQSKKVQCDLFFAKGVSLMYAFSDERAMCAALKKSRLAIFDYTFSRRGKLQHYVGTGVPVTYLNLAKCQNLLKVKKKQLILKPYRIKTYHTDPNKVTYDCIYGEPKLVARYFKELKSKTGETLATYGDPKFVRAE